MKKTIWILWKLAASKRMLVVALGGLLVMAAGTAFFMKHDTDTSKQQKDRLHAEALLKEATEVWVNRQLHKLKIPFSSQGDNSEAKRPQRRMVTDTGIVVVPIDSVKEERRLLSSGFLASSVHYLLMSDTTFMDGLRQQWQERVNRELPYYKVALELIQQRPNNAGQPRRIVAGDVALCVPENELGNYYLDGMYLYEMKAYWTASPMKWHWMCIWGVALGGVALFLFIPFNDKVAKHKEKESKYQMGKILFDEREMTLTLDGQVVPCPKQPYKLLVAFFQAEGHFLSDAQIVEICGWNADDIGLDNKRKTAISQLRRLLDSNKSHVYVDRVQDKYGENGFVFHCC